MNNQAKIELEELRRNVKVLVEKKEYSTALEIIEKSRFQNDGTLLIIAADCFYELGKDLQALERYLKYLKVFPQGRAKNFALFNSALCLENIGLYSEANDILKAVEENHPNLSSEIDHAQFKIKEIESARVLLKQLMPQASDGI